MRRPSSYQLAGPVLAVSFLIALAGCGGGGGGGSTAPNPVPTPTPAPTPQVVSQGTGLALEANAVGWTTFTTTRAGALDVTVDWTYATNDVDVLIAKGTCDADQLEANQCAILTYSISTTAKPEKAHADSADAGAYTLFVENTGDRDDAVSFQVVLTPRATGDAGPQASSRRPAAEANPLGHKAPIRGRAELR
jgi:hypothetical protein